MEIPVVVLVVEDEALIQDFLESGLQDGGYKVEKAFSAEEAIRMLNARSDDHFGALITDINLGSSLNGWDVARHARALFPELPVIYVTTASPYDWSYMGVNNSVLLTKPFAAAQVVSALSQLLNAAALATPIPSDAN